MANSFLDTVDGYLSQQSTWKGIVGFVGGLGFVAMSPTLQNAIIGVAMAVIGLINVIRDERKLTPPATPPAA